MASGAGNVAEGGGAGCAVLVLVLVLVAVLVLMLVLVLLVLGGLILGNRAGRPRGCDYSKQSRRIDL